MITSTANNQIKLLSKLMKMSKARKEKKRFIAEGMKMTAEAIRLGIAEKIYVTTLGKEALQEIFAEEISCPIETVTEEVFSAITDTVSPQGVLALVKMPFYDINTIFLQKQANFLFLENIRDPGNLGTIFRTAECAGIKGIILSNGCADIYNPKVVRATMGTIFRMPFVYTREFFNIIAQAKRNGIQIFAAHLKGDRDFFKEDYRGKTAFIIGNEANGITEEVAKMADTLVKIPMEGHSESLNASIAAAIIMYEAYRQKKMEMN